MMTLDLPDFSLAWDQPHYLLAQVEQRQSHPIATSPAPTGVIMAQASPPTVTPAMIRKVEKWSTRACTNVENQSSKHATGFPGGSMGPTAMVISLLQYDAKFMPSEPVIATLTVPPKHGKVVSQGMVKRTRGSFTGNMEQFIYVPQPHFYGIDRAEFEVKANGGKFRVKYIINVEEYNTSEGDGGFCNDYIQGQAEPKFQIAVESTEELTSGSNKGAAKYIADASKSLNSLFPRNTIDHSDIARAKTILAIDATESNIDKGAVINREPPQIKSLEKNFHIYSQPPKWLDFGKLLLADASGAVAVDILLSQASLPPPPTSTPAIIRKVEKYRNNRSFSPNIQQEEAALIITASDGGDAYAYDYILKDCIETQHTPNNPRSAMRGLPIAAMLSDYYARYLGKTVNTAEIETSIIANTSKGKLTSEVGVSGRLSYGYDPNPGFIGNDQAIFMAEYKGKRYKIILDIKVLITVDENTPVCPEPKLIKVKKPVASLLDKVLGVSDIPFADFAGPTLAQTTGTGPAAQITLDTDASGYGWFIDYTPYLKAATLGPLARKRPGYQIAAMASAVAIARHKE